MSRTLRGEQFADLLAGNQLGVLSAANTFPGSFESWVHEVLHTHGPVRLLDSDDVDAEFGPDDQAVTIGMIGAPPALFEIPPRGDEPVIAVRALERTLGHRFAALAALNVAGPAGLIAVAAACLLDLPLLNCDGMGRVFPLIDQTTYALNGLSPSPLAAVGPWGDVVVIDSPQDRSETMVRAAVTAAGGWMFAALYPAPVANLFRAGIPDAITRCVESGATLRLGAGNLGQRLAHQLGGRLLGRGRVIEIEQRPGLGNSSRRQPARPMSILIEDGGSAHARVRLEVRNEVVLATIDGGIVASAPDTICLLDPLRRRTVDLLDLTLGDVMEVLLLPVDPAWHTPEGQVIAGPAAFGVPIQAHRASR